MPDVRTLPFTSSSGAGNMAADEAMLVGAAEHAVASLRVYSWDTPTLSLGYFQEASIRKSDERLAHLPWVRRSTGGAAIVHDPETELTYSLALPAGELWQPRGESWICRVHHALQDTLRSVWGIESKLVVCGEEQKRGPLLCFLHQTAGDLLVDGHKVAGSAQRKHKGALLQHGSILLRQSYLTPLLPGIRELTTHNISFDDLAIALTRRLAVDTGWHFAPAAWTTEELATTQRIEMEKFGAVTWNEKR